MMTILLVTSTGILSDIQINLSPFCCSLRKTALIFPTEYGEITCKLKILVNTGKQFDFIKEFNTGKIQV